jgi:putative secretion ATPase (PEP-CTERM system associated)
MYESYFGLKKKPFELVPNPEFLYPSKAHRRARVYLDYGINERAGFILLTGEVGSGKTTIIRELIKKQRLGVVLSKVFNTNVSFDQLLAMVNDDFHLDVAGKDRISLMRDLNDFLIEQYSLGNRPTLIIDEAQNLSAELLEDIRMLSNLETDDAKLLQIILVGQPELRSTLSLPELLQLRQRISINCHITPLSRDEVEEYIFHRLEVAGNRKAVTFQPDAVDIIYRYSKGVPRLINIICDFLMLSAFAEETVVLDGDMTRDVIGDLDFENQYWESGLLRKVEPLAESCMIPTNSMETSNPDEVLRPITDRLDSLEKDSRQFKKDVLSALDDKIDELSKNLQMMTRENQVSVSELRRMVLDQTSRQEETTLPSEEERNPKQGFLRKIFG